MSKIIDIDNEEQILKECDFNYYYDSEECSRELCMFYNDITQQRANFNKRQARIDLGRIGITLNKQAQRIAELEEQLKNAIVPKFKFMEKVYHINKDYFYKKDWFVEELLINGFEYKIDKRKNSLVMWYSTYFDDYKNYKYQEKDLFATKEEAQEKLKELGEKK